MPTQTELPRSLLARNAAVVTVQLAKGLAWTHTLAIAAILAAMAIGWGLSLLSRRSRSTPQRS